MAEMKYKLFVGLFLFIATTTAVVVEDPNEESRLYTWAEVRGMKAKCPPGEYVVCTQCPKNTYKPRAGTQRKCADCDPKKGTVDIGTSKCTKLCKPGKMASKLGGCEDCPVGNYTDVSNLDSKCKPCPERQTTDGKGAAMCICIKGHQPTTDGKDCEPCPDGTYKDKGGNFACTPCPATKPSTRSDGALSKESCTKVCDAGKQLNESDGSCDPCEKNFHKPLPGSREKCKPCEPNTVAKSKGSTSCDVECGLGFEFNFDTGRCRQCPWATYKNKVGNDVPCLPCTSETGPVKVTVMRGAKDRPTDCVKKSDCFTQSLQDLEDYYNIIESQAFDENENLISALNSTCYNEIHDLVIKVMQDFMVCTDLRDIILPEIKIGRGTYGHDIQMELVLSIEKYMIANPGKTYCDYLECVNPHMNEIAKCKSKMPKQEGLQFCSEPWRVAASCLTLNMMNCPLLQFLPKVTEDLNLHVNELKPSDIADIGNMLELCDGAPRGNTEGEDDSSGDGEPSGDGDSSGDIKSFEECELQMGPFLAHLTDLDGLCKSMDDLLDILSCFEEGGYGDQFFGIYGSTLSLLLPGLIPFELSFNDVRQAGKDYCGSVEKQGQCPNLKSDIMGACYEGCSNDWDCEGDLKCCDNGCGRSCFDPAGTEEDPGLAECYAKYNPEHYMSIDAMCNNIDAIAESLSCFYDGNYFDAFLKGDGGSLAALAEGFDMLDFDTLMEAITSQCSSPDPIYECVAILNPIISQLISVDAVCANEEAIISAISCFEGHGLVDYFMETYIPLITAILEFEINSLADLENAFGMYCAFSGLPLK